MVPKYYKIRNKSGENNSIKNFHLYLRLYGLAFGLFLNSAIQIILEICQVEIIVLCGVVTTIELYPGRQKILPHVGISRFFSPRNKNDVLSWARAINLINRDQFQDFVEYKGLLK